MNTNSYLKVGTYNLNLIGKIGTSVSSTLAFTVIVANPCASVTINPVADSNIVYYTT